jgi:hypothetical protein
LEKIVKNDPKSPAVGVVDGAYLGTLTKACTKCGEVKGFDEFTRYSYKGEWRRKGACKRCLLAQAGAWRRANPDKVSETNRRSRDGMSDERKKELSERGAENVRRRKAEEPGYKERITQQLAEWHQRRRNGEGGAEYLARRNQKTTEWQRRMRAGDKADEFRQKIRERMAVWSEKNHQRIREWKRAYVARTPERIRENLKAWRSRNKARTSMYGRRRYESERATLWANAERMEAAYTEARRLTAETGVPHEVDHVIPIASSYVCGLHTHDNLRVVTRVENRCKSNRIHVEDAPLFFHVPEKNIYKADEV